MNAFQNIPASQQEEFIRNMEALQRQEGIRLYHGLVFRCFEECANSFRSKSLDDKEVTCLENCADKFIKLAQRVGFRYAEYQSQSTQGSGPALR